MNNDTRRKLLANIGALSLFPLLKLSSLTKKKNVISCSPETSVQKVKMLTQDGILVEVDMSKVKGNKQKITNKELQSWVKKEI